MDDRIQEGKVVVGKGEQSEMKKIWEKPKLIVLLRGRPEELVLAGCKMAGIRASNQNRNNGCNRQGNCGGNCQLITQS
jgi:hypothetical protein